MIEIIVFDTLRLDVITFGFRWTHPSPGGAVIKFPVNGDAASIPRVLRELATTIERHLIAGISSPTIVG